MADIIIVRRNCSTCDATEDSTTNEFENIKEATIAFDSEDPVTLHVCSKCRASVFDGLLELGIRQVTKPKRKAKAKATSEGEFGCRYCERKFLKSQGRGRHEGSAHKDQVHLKITPATKRKSRRSA